MANLAHEFLHAHAVRQADPLGSQDMAHQVACAGIIHLRQLRRDDPTMPHGLLPIDPRQVRQQSLAFGEMRCGACKGSHAAGKAIP